MSSLPRLKNIRLRKTNIPVSRANSLAGSRDAEIIRDLRRAEADLPEISAVRRDGALLRSVGSGQKHLAVWRWLFSTPRASTADDEGDMPSLIAMTPLGKTDRSAGLHVQSFADSPQQKQIIFAHCTLPLTMPSAFRLMTHFEIRSGRRAGRSSARRRRDYL